MAYAGSRLEAIENIVKDLANDDSAVQLSQTQFIRLANMARRHVASKGEFFKVDTFDAEEDVEAYNLVTAFSDIVKLRTLRWSNGVTNDADYPYMKRVDNWLEFDKLRSGNLNWVPSEPRYWTVLGNLVYVYPAPATAMTDGFEAAFDYLPAAWNTSDSYTPETPEAFDDMYAYFILALRFKRDYAAQNGDEEANMWRQWFDDMFADYQATKYGPMTLTPG